MVEYQEVDTELQNLRTDAGIEAKTLIEADEPVTIILGEHVNGNHVTVDVQHFAAIAVDRELDEDEQAVHQQERLVFSSILVAAEDGETSQETIVNVRDGGIDSAIEALEMVTEDGTINAMETQLMDLQVVDGEVIEVEQEPPLDEEIEE